MLILSPTTELWLPKPDLWIPDRKIRKPSIQERGWLERGWPALPMQAAITFTVADSNYATGDPAVPTLTDTPAVGQLMVALASERSGTTEADFTINGTGWTKAYGHDNDIGIGSSRISTIMWTKRAVASEPTSVSIDNGTANTKYAVLMEFTPSEPVSAYVVPAGGTSTTGGGSSGTSPIATGDTSSLAAADYLILAVATFRTSTADVQSPAVDFTEDFLEEFNLGGDNVCNFFVPGFDDLAGGVYNASLSWAGTNEAEHIGCIAAIEAQTAAAAVSIPSLVTAPYIAA